MEAIGAHAISGRLFNENDFVKGAAPVAIVNEPFVRKFLGGRNPIGRRIRVDNQRAGGLIDDDRRERRPSRNRGGRSSVSCRISD